MSRTDTMLSFAYGSNMLSRRLRARVPSARTVGPARLRGYQLRWHKMSADQSGKCDVVPAGARQAVVHGVLYQLPANEKAWLDRAEGLGSGYAQRQIEVETTAGPALAWLYYATAVDPLIVPYTWYRALVVAGAQEHRLPSAYAALVAATAAVQDRNSERHARHMALVHCG